MSDDTDRRTAETRSAGHPPRRRRTTRLAAALLMPAAFLLASIATAEERREELVIFTRDTGSPVAERFAGEHLPALRAQAAALDLPVRVVDVADAGAPAEVHLTPLIVYQSPRGRSIFQGRYVDVGKVAHFVRTQRAVPPASGRLEAEDAAVAELGRARVLAPIKITALTGDLPPGHDAKRFHQQARDAILGGFERFERRRSAALGPSDRIAYMDFHPYRSADGRFFVATALFSQFDCIDPVFTAFDAPVAGDAAAWREVFARAARQLEAAAFEMIRTSAIGDGFDGVPTRLATLSWAALDLELPTAPEGAVVVDASVELPTRWRVAEPAPDAGPRLVFRFPPPLDRYSGEVAGLAGELTLAARDQLDGARGHLVAETSTVTMGEKALDNAIHGKMIAVDRFPEARFELESAEADRPLAFGRTSRLVAAGTFTMMGIDIPLDVRAQLEPVIGGDGAPRLHVQAGFGIRLEKPFGIAGPDGPAPANDTLDFHLDVMLEAADGADG